VWLVPLHDAHFRIFDGVALTIIRHLAPKPSDDQYDRYVKGLDNVLNVAWLDAMCVNTASDTSALTKGELQAALASLFFWGQAKIAPQSSG